LTGASECGTLFGVSNPKVDKLQTAIEALRGLLSSPATSVDTAVRISQLLTALTEELNSAKKEEKS